MTTMQEQSPQEPASWVPLHVHSQYSILDATASISAIAERAAEYQMPAVALTDHGNLYGAVEFYKACQGKGVKPIIGCEVYVAPESRHTKKKIPGTRVHYHLTLLAKNAEGYQNLCRLSSLGFLEGFYFHPRIDEDLLKQHSAGLICLSGCLSSRIAHEALQGTPDKLLEHVRWYREVFGDDYYLELMRHPMTEEALMREGIMGESWLIQKYGDYIDKQNRLNATLLRLSKELSIPYVATNDSHYIDREDWRAHEILLNIQSGEPCEILEQMADGRQLRTPNPRRTTYSSHECYFKSPQQMRSVFHDLPEALSTSIDIAAKCTLALDFKTKHYPVYVPPKLVGTTYTQAEQAEAAEQFLRDLCEKGIAERYTPERLEAVATVYPGRDPMEVVRSRLTYEMNVIAPKGMCDYLLIVWDFIHWAKNRRIPMGPGRGSGAGSIILYLIGVTDIEPLRFSLFFERFINPERISYPDIDVDICMDRRADVIAYTLEKYGKDNVAQIITFNTMKARMTIKDVGRVLNIPLAKVNEIAKLVPDDLNITLKAALEKEPELRKLVDIDEDANRILEIGYKLEGSIRNTGIHAAGLIIAGDPLTNFIPLCAAKDSDMPVTQFSMKPVEDVGMLKIDFLGLKTLTSIQLAVDAIAANTGRTIDWVNLPLDDKATFDLLNQGKTSSVFQLESSGMQDLARQLHLDRFEEIIAVGALYRPGPMDMIPSFINRKHGREPIEYDHPKLNEILSETYGIMVYQEQVMQIASDLAGYSLGEGDVLRRAMGKKEADKMAKQREKFRLGALKNGIDEDTSMRIFDKMEKFAAYGFNKSHATAYGYLSYVTGFLKANYPKEWFAALMTCDRDDLTKVSKFIREGQSMNIAILPPDINEAGDVFVATEKGIRFAMSGIKGIGSGIVASIVEERKRKGPFVSFYDFFTRLDVRKIGKKSIEHLVEAGCFDSTGWTRDQLLQSIEPMLENAVKEREDHERGFLNLFSKLKDGGNARFEKPPPVASPRPKLELLSKEKELLGFFLTGHPMDQYQPILKRLSCVPMRKVEELAHNTVFRSTVIVENVQTRISAKSQKKFAILTVSDGLERYELPIWPEQYEEKKGLLRENQLLYCVLQIENREGAIRLSCHWLDDLTKVNEAMIQASDQAYDKAKATIGRHRDRLPSEKKNNPPRTENTKAPPMAKSTPQVSIIRLDADKTRLSAIVSLGDLIRQHPGDSPLKVEFHSQGQPLATLHIDAELNISWSDALRKALCTIPGVEIVTKP